MAQQITDNFLLNAAKDLDDKKGVLKSGVWSPYDNVAEFTARFPNVNSRAEGQFFWVRSPTDANKADLYTVAKNKTVYKVQADVDLSAYSTTVQMNTAISEAVTPIEEGLNSTNEVLMAEIQDRQDGDAANALAISNEVTRATGAEDAIAAQLSNKVDSASVFSPVIIHKSDLTGNTYTNIKFANIDVVVSYTDSAGTRDFELTFSSTGVLTLPYPAGSIENGFFAQISGVTGVADLAGLQEEIDAVNLNARVISVPFSILTFPEYGIAIADGLAKRTGATLTLSCSSFVELPDIWSSITYSAIQGSVYGLCFYDSNQAYIIGSGIAATATGDKTITNSYPTAKYFRYHYYTAQPENWKFLITAGIDFKNTYPTLLNHDAELYGVYTTKNQNKNIIPYTDSILKAVGFGVNSSGTVTATGASALSASREYLRLPENWDQFVATLPLSTGFGIAFYNDANALLRYYPGSPTPSIVTVIPADVPEAKFYRVCYQTASKSNFYIKIRTSALDLNIQELNNIHQTTDQKGYDLIHYDSSILTLVGGVSGSTLNPNITTLRSTEYMPLPKDWLFIEYKTTDISATYGLKFFDDSGGILQSFILSGIYKKRITPADITTGKPFYFRYTYAISLLPDFFFSIAVSNSATNAGAYNISELNYTLEETKLANLLIQSYETTPAITKETIFSESDNPSKPFARIPTTIVTNAGTVLAACEMRNSSADLGEYDIMLKRRTVGETTWTTQTIYPYSSETYGRGMNPSFVIDRTGVHGVVGRIFMFVLTVKDPAKLAIKSTTAELDSVYKYSDDDGITWSSIVSIKSGWNTTLYTGAGSSPANGIQMVDGTLVVPGFFIVAELYRAGLFYKKVSGAWTYSNMTLTSRDNECTVIETAENKIVLNVRIDPSTITVRRLRNIYEFNFDTNSFTFHPTDKTFNAIVHCQGSLEALTLGGKRVYLFSFPDSITEGIAVNSGNRRNLTIWASLDLKKWIRVYRAYTPAALGYGVVSHHNGKLVYAYEAETYNIEFQDISPIIPLIQTSALDKSPLSTEDRLSELIIEVQKNNGSPWIEE